MKTVLAVLLTCAFLLPAFSAVFRALWYVSSQSQAFLGMPATWGLSSRVIVGGE